MECADTESDVVANVATPLLIVPVPSAVDPSWNVTVPVAVEGDIVAVKVTDWPKADGFSEEVRVVVVGAWLMTWLKVADVLTASLVSPL
jgi:hypothetical protein